MANRNRPSGKKAKKPAQPIPEIPGLGKLHKPRKGNRRAAKLIESGVRLWDQRHIDRKARRRAIAREENKECRREDGRAVGLFAKELIAATPNWKAGEGRAHIVPVDDRDVRVEELIAAAEGLELRNPGGRPLRFYVAGLTYPEHIRLRANLPAGIMALSSYHERTATAENGRNIRLNSFDPREQNS